MKKCQSGEELVKDRSGRSGAGKVNKREWGGKTFVQMRTGKSGELLMDNRVGKLSDG